MDKFKCLQAENQQLKAENQQLRVENQQLKQEIQTLREKLAELEAQLKKRIEQLNQNSRNSNWPSSRDKSRPKKPKRKRSGRSAGGQKGHQGHTLAQVAEPDEIESHRPTHCANCAHELDEAAEVVQSDKRQVIDLPPLHFITTEHQAETVLCPDCGHTTRGDFPEGVTQPVQYGPRVKQLAVYLRTEQFVPYERSRQLLADLFELPICVGSLQNFVRRAAQQVAQPLQKIKEALTQEAVVQADETGFYIGGDRYWLHTASTNELSYYEAHQRRGQKAVRKIDILPQVEGVLVHDAWATYFLFDQADHALCHAHHLRDLTAIIENDAQQWAKRMMDFLLAAKKVVDVAREGGESQLSPDVLERAEQLWTTILTLGFEENPLPETPPPQVQRGRLKKSKARNLLERFQKREAACLRFMRDFKVPFDNNLAERDIRMMKVQQKVSGCFRSTAGAEQFCQLRSYTATIRKQGQSVWEALGSLFAGDVLMPTSIPV